MKKTAVFLILLLTIAFLCACIKPNLSPERFNIEAGNSAYIQENETLMPISATKLTVPDNTLPNKPYTDIGIIIVSAESDMLDENLEPLVLYGIADVFGNAYTECIYQDIIVSGNFIMAKFDDETNISYDFYYKDGTKLFNTENVISGFAAIDEEYFVLYTEENSEVFNKYGSALFGVSRQLGSDYNYSICDSYLFAQEPDEAKFFIYRIIGDTLMLLKSYLSTSNKIYSVGYIGEGDFLVISTNTAEDNSYSYKDIIEDETYYYNQITKIYNENSGEKIFTSEELLIGIVNNYTPTVDYSARKNLNLREGYSMAYTIVTDTNKLYTGQECYIINSDVLTVVKMPEGMTPFMFKYYDGYGFAGNAVSGYRAALFDLSGKTIWTKEDTEYYAQNYNNERYVLAKSIEGVLAYGLLDSRGNTLIDFNLDYLAPFAGEFSVAETDGHYYKVNKNGELISEITDIRKDNTQFTFNYYIYQNGDKIGVKNYNGDILIEAIYESVEFQGYINGKNYIILNAGDSLDAYLIES